ncbi:MAG: hypothetical protein MJZ36_03110 [Bacteroidaceae bacterium]|nr:hypothetical protein [Bacteroidaceae bacterium]
MNKNIIYLFSAAALLASCSGKLKLTADNFSVTPTPLEYVAGEVPATISANIPAKAMPKKAIVTCTPYLKWNGGQSVGSSATFQGEKVEANNTIISYKNGGNATMRSSFPFQNGMQNSELWMQFTAKKGNKTISVPDVKIGYGVQCTAALVSETSRDANHSVAQDNFQRIISQKQAASIKFLIGQANLRGSELNSKNVQEFIQTLKNIKSDEQSLVLQNVEISAYASPDGAYSINEKLAAKRGAVSENYVSGQMKKQKLNGNIDTKYTAEDWDGFQELVKQSNLEDKDIILRVLSMYQDPEQREREIRNIATVYGELATAVLPELRRARMVINYDVVGRSDEEILSQFNADASKLSVEEILYAANCLSDNERLTSNMYVRATELYPNDYRAYNNLGVKAMEHGDYDSATSFFKKALSKNTNAGEANVNLGYMELFKGNIADAEYYIAKAATADNLKEAQGNLYIAQGKYGQAASYLSEVSNNSGALAQIMNNDYATATKLLNGIKNANAMTYYLKAIIGARTNSGSDVSENLQKAVSMDSTFATRALNDVEFAKYASIVKALR